MPTVFISVHLLPAYTRNAKPRQDCRDIGDSGSWGSRDDDLFAARPRQFWRKEPAIDDHTDQVERKALSDRMRCK